MNPDQLYAVVPVYIVPRSHGRKPEPRYDLAPMNHQAACNWMDACRNQWTDYILIPWPDDVPHQAPPCLATDYRRDRKQLQVA